MPSAEDYSDGLVCSNILLIIVLARVGGVFHPLGDGHDPEHQERGGVWSSAAAARRAVFLQPPHGRRAHCQQHHHQTFPEDEVRLGRRDLVGDGNVNVCTVLFLRTIEATSQ